MRMRLIGVNRDDERVVAPRETHGELMAYFLRLPRRNLPRLEALPDVIRDDIPFTLTAPGYIFIFALGEMEFLVNRARVAGIAGDELSAPCLVGIFRVIGAFHNGTQDTFALLRMKRLYPCSGHIS